MALPPDSDLQKALSRGDVEGAFFLFGDAPQLRDAAAQRVLDAALDPATREFNLDRFRADDVDPEALASAIHTPPMLAPRRVVLLLEAQELPTAAGKIVEGALEALPTGLTLVITAAPTSGKAATKLLDRLKAGCRSYEWSTPREEEVPGWLLRRAPDAHGYELTEEAAQAIATAVGADLGLLEAELSKLESAAEDGRVSLDVVRQLVPNVRLVNRWEWLDLVAARRYETALARLPVLLGDSRESAVGLLAAMIDQHLCLALAVEGGAALVRRALGEAGKRYLAWKANAYARQASNWTGADLEEAVELMRRADQRVKSSVTDAAALEELLLALRALGRKAA